MISWDMGLFGKNYWHQSSADLVKSGIHHNPDGSVAIDIRGDKRLLDLTDQVKREIETVRKAGKEFTEKQICSRIGELMHSDKYYGSYDKGTIERLDKKKEIEGQIGDVTIDPTLSEGQKKAKLSELSTKLEETFKEGGKYYDSRGGQNLKDYPKGKLVCREEAVVMSYVMHQVGIPNRLELNIHGSLTDLHAFVQSDVTQAIIESTAGKHGYLEVVNNGNISKGEVAITADGTYYGIGKAEWGDNAKMAKAVAKASTAGEYLDSAGKVLQEIKDRERLQAHEKYSDEATRDYKKNPNPDMDGISIKEATRIQDGFEGSLDVGIGVWKSGKGDHEITVGELVKGLEKAGCKLKPDAANVIKNAYMGVRTEEQKRNNQNVWSEKIDDPRPDDFNYTKNSQYTEMSWMDKNGDGKISMKEIKDTLSTHEIKIAEQYGLQAAIYCHNNKIGDAIDVGTKSR